MRLRGSSAGWHSRTGDRQELRLSERGLELSHRTLLLGRVLRETETLIPLSNLANVKREVQYPRLGLYAGLLALIAGTYVGTGLFVDGIRVPGGSPSLLGMGLAAMALGIVLDFALSAVTDVLNNTCRLIVTPFTGAAFVSKGSNPKLRIASSRDSPKRPPLLLSVQPRPSTRRGGGRRQGRRIAVHRVDPGLGESEQTLELSRRDPRVTMNDLADGA